VSILLQIIDYFFGQFFLERNSHILEKKILGCSLPNFLENNLFGKKLCSILSIALRMWFFLTQIDT